MSREPEDIWRSQALATVWSAAEWTAAHRFAQARFDGTISHMVMHRIVLRGSLEVSLGEHNLKATQCDTDVAEIDGRWSSRRRENCRSVDKVALSEGCDGSKCRGVVVA